MPEVGLDEISSKRSVGRPAHAYKYRGALLCFVNNVVYGEASEDSRVSWPS